MGLYDNAYFSVYEEIKRFYPVWYWDVLEMDAIWRAQGKQLDQVREAVQRLISNNFIATSDDQAVTALEEVFGVVTDTDRTIEDRRHCCCPCCAAGDTSVHAKSRRSWLHLPMHPAMWILRAQPSTCVSTATVEIPLHWTTAI